MTTDRLAQRLREFNKAVERLAEALAAPPSDLTRDAVIQRFEFSFELAWKSLKAYLEGQGSAAPNPRAALREAFAQGLIASEQDADAWMVMLEDRNLTSHTYREDLAQAIHARIKQDHCKRLRDLAERLSAAP